MTKHLKVKQYPNLFIISQQSIKMYILQLNKASHRRTNVLHTLNSHKD